ncbi:MAG TPA: serine/threonine-protein kinase [Myxococcales bacterium]|nr:serine/threonine-protein kinase [Myxococcales bacterium]
MGEPRPPPSFGRYRDAVLLGAGEMGAVYRALDPSLGRAVAIKVLTQRAPRHLERFRREAEVLAKIDHPAIVRIHEVVEADEEGKGPYIVMEYCPGRLLEAVLQAGPLPPAQVVSIVRQVAEGLQTAHVRDVVHRDIKPANLVVSEAGGVKILDFGVAWLRDASRDLAGSIVRGTPYYMSPEQAMGQPIDARSDIYSLGITAFEMLTGRRPFEARSKVDVMLLQARAPLPPLRDFDPRLARIVEKMCAKEPADRYPRCDALVADLDALPRGLGGRGP